MNSSKPEEPLTMEVTAEEGTAWIKSSRPGGSHTKQNPEPLFICCLFSLLPSPLALSRFETPRDLQQMP